MEKQEKKPADFENCFVLEALCTKFGFHYFDTKKEALSFAQEERLKDPAGKRICVDREKLRSKTVYTVYKTAPER